MLKRQAGPMTFADRKSRVFSKHIRPGFETLETRTLFTVAISPQEQLFVELINRARADPEAEVRRNSAVDTLNQDVAEDRLISSDPKQPLAPHQALADAMVGHLDDMFRRDYFGHDSPEGETPSDRARAAGYPVGAGENIAWSGNTGGIERTQEVYDRHDGLFESVGHRVNMMRPNWREVGPAIRYGIFTQEGTNFQSIMAGSMFGDRGGDYFITGVVISDILVTNNFYEIGEGIGNARVRAVNLETSEAYEVRTGPAGGYSLQVPDGIYEVTATGNGISHPLVVRAVHMDGENIKVDFNTHRMDTRYLQGRFYEDVNGNRRRDQGDIVVGGLTAFADLNENGQLDTGEPSDIADSTGAFRMDLLLPGQYVVRAQVPDDWRATTGDNYQINASRQSIVGIDFGLQKVDLAPHSADDHGVVFPGDDIAISVLQNDSDHEGELDVGSIRLVSMPQHGLVTVQGQQIVYQSDVEFVGRDSFSYTVSDLAGQSSNVATVSVDVGSAWQNWLEPRDVDGDGFIAPRDVLALVLDLNTLGSRYLQDTPRGPSDLHLDVSGDGYVSPIDVLRVVLYLNNIPAGEPPERIATTDEFFLAFAAASDDDEAALVSVSAFA